MTPNKKTAKILAKGGVQMATEREKREQQERAYYENRYARAMLEAGKVEEYIYYLDVNHNPLKCGMSPNEVDAIQKRADETAQMSTRAGNSTSK